MFYLFRGVIVVARWECSRGLTLGLSPVTGSLACVFFPLFVIQILSVSAVYLDILGDWIAGGLKKRESGWAATWISYSGCIQTQGEASVASSWSLLICASAFSCMVSPSPATFIFLYEYSGVAELLQRQKQFLFTAWICQGRWKISEYRTCFSFLQVFEKLPVQCPKIRQDISPTISKESPLICPEVNNSSVYF